LSQGQGEAVFESDGTFTHLHNERPAVMNQGFILTLLLVSCNCLLHLTELAAQSDDSSERNRSNIQLTASKQSSDRIIPHIDDEGPGTAIYIQNLLGSNQKIQSQQIGSKRKAFVVLGMPRSASSMFVHRLHDEGFGNSGELLWHGRSTLKQIVQHWRMNCSVWPLDTCDQGCLTKALDIYWRKCKNQRCGFKVFPEHLESCTSGPQYFRDIGVNKVIIWERRNQTAQYESLAKAYATGDWGFGGPSGKRDTEWSKKNPQQEFVRAMNQWYTTLREVYNTSLHVYAEDYLTMPVQRKRVSYYLKSDITSPSPV